MRKSGNGPDVDLDQFLDDIKTVVRDGEELLKTGVSEAKQRALTRVKTTGRAMRDHPGKSLGIVFGLGVLVGVLATAHFTDEEVD